MKASRFLVPAGLVVVAHGASAQHRVPCDVGACAVGDLSYFDHTGADWNCGSRRYQGHKGTDFLTDWVSYGETVVDADVVSPVTGVAYEPPKNDCDLDYCVSVASCKATMKCDVKPTPQARSDCNNWCSARDKNSSKCVGCGGGLGNRLLIADRFGRVTALGHMKAGSVGSYRPNRVNLSRGETVTCGEVVGKIASSGASSWPHVHIEIWESQDDDRERDLFATPSFAPKRCADSFSFWVDQGQYAVHPGTTCYPCEVEPGARQHVPANELRTAPFYLKNFGTERERLAFQEAYAYVRYREETGRPIESGHQEPGLGCPLYTDDEGVEHVSFVHEAPAASDILIQDFLQKDKARRFTASAGDTAIVYKSGERQAYLLRAGFWGVYKCLKLEPSDGGPDPERMGGPKWLGAPTSHERYPREGDIERFDASKEPEAAFQSFEKGYMSWQSGQLYVHFVESLLASGVTAEALVASASHCGAIGGVSKNTPTTPDYCDKGDVQSCYDGPDDTLGVGECSSGAQFCESVPPAGANWTDCGVVQVLPQPEDCFDGLDNDCDADPDCDDNDCDSQPECGGVCDTCSLGVDECTGSTGRSGRRCRMDSGALCPAWKPFACSDGQMCRNGSCIICGTLLQPCCEVEGVARCVVGSCVDAACTESGSGGAGGTGAGTGGIDGSIAGGGAGGMMGVGGTAGSSSEAGMGGMMGMGGSGATGGDTGVGGSASGSGGSAGSAGSGGTSGATANGGVGNLAGLGNAGGTVGGGTTGGTGGSGAGGLAGSAGSSNHDVVVRCDPPSGWSVNYASYWKVPPSGGWEDHPGSTADADPSSAFEVQESLKEGWRMEITFNLTDSNGNERWSYDFSTDPTGSGVFGVPQCESEARLDGESVEPEYVGNPYDPPGAPWCFYTNMNVPTPTAPDPDTPPNVLCSSP